MINKLKPKSEFSRSVLTLMTGTTIAQAIPIAISPILTRIYTPEDFGVFALYTSITTLFAMIITGRYELAIMLPRKTNDAKQILYLSLFIAIFISTSLLLVIILFESQIVSLLNNKEITKWLYLIPISVLCIGIYQSLNYYMNRNNQYITIAQSRIGTALSNATGSLFMGWVLKENAFGLIFGDLIGKISGIIILIKKRNILKNTKVSPIKIIALAKKYKKFPLVNSLHAFINSLKNNIVFIFISNSYTSSILGSFYFVLRIMMLPGGIIGNSIAQVFYREASLEYNKSKDIQILLRKMIMKLTLFASVPAVIILFFGEQIFVFVFGQEWAIAGTYAKYFVPYIYLHFVASPLGIIPLITNKQDKAFFWGLAESFLFVIVFVLGYYIYKDLALSLLLLSLVFCIYFPFYFRWIYKISRKVSDEQ